MANNHLITEILKEGKIILYPTDTVWGWGVMLQILKR